MSSFLMRMQICHANSLGCPGDERGILATPGTALSCRPGDSPSSRDSRSASLDIDVEPELLVH